MGNLGAHFTDADRQSLIVASSCIRLRMAQDPVFMALAILIEQALAIERASGAVARNATEQTRKCMIDGCSNRVSHKGACDECCKTAQDDSKETK